MVKYHKKDILHYLLKEKTSLLNTDGFCIPERYKLKGNVLYILETYYSSQGKVKFKQIEVTILFPEACSMKEYSELSHPYFYDVPKKIFREAIKYPPRNEDSKKYRDIVRETIKYKSK
ncbi:MAG: hypothetical protein HPY53_01460 [Brevinematales bacterium]|nr:hypothetical protein [Brevinematales bacterium]